MRPRMTPRGLRALLLLPTLTVGSLAAGGVLTQLPAQAKTAAAAKGTIEICKSSANGMTGTSFNFSYTDHTGAGGSLSVVGGGCSGPLSVAGGTVTVTEASNQGTKVQGISLSPSGRKVSINLGTGTAVVRAPAGGTETVVTYTNVVPGASLKICKQAASNSTQLIGQPFSFTVNGGPATTIDAGPWGSPNCTGLTDYAAGTKVTVVELKPAANVSVSSIGVTEPPATNVSTSLATRTVSLTLGSGVNIVTYTNQVNVTAQKGYLEICKYGTDQFVSGYFTFNVTDAAGINYGPFSVLVGQCTGQIELTAGPATITEAPTPTTYLDYVDVYPEQNYISENDTNRTATVSIVAGAPNNETVAEFFNDTILGYAKVCKTLDSANSDALAGDTFTFNYKDATGTGSVEIVANSYENGPACAWINSGDGIPVGSPVTITENPTTNVDLVGVSISPASADTGSSPATGAAFTVQPGITAATFTNQAEGTIELCKDAADAQTYGKPFDFSVNNGPSFTVNAGQCSQAITVPAGTATVYEFPSTNYHLVSVTATGPVGDNRLLSGTNPITVSTPFGGVGNETLVTYTNAVNTGEFKICKTTSEPQIIGSVSFTFDYSYTVDGTTTIGSTSMTPGQCSGLFGPIPVLDSAGNPVQVNVTEVATAGDYVNTITYAGNGSLVSSSTAAGTSCFDLGYGVNTITYDNEVDPQGQGL
jgi:hypothetical protein